MTKFYNYEEDFSWLELLGWNELTPTEKDCFNKYNKWVDSLPTYYPRVHG